MTARSLLSGSAPAQTPPTVGTLDPDFVVILAALLCALICVLGLAAVARCAWIRRLSISTSGQLGSATPPPNKGLKKKVLKSLPSQKFEGESEDECAICLAEFAAGEEIRVLPQCGHGFHIGCIDTWLKSHSTCPSCRQILAARCNKCGGGDGGGEVRPEPREAPVHMFLP